MSCGEGSKVRYLGISRNSLSLHLSEHHGDASPGSTVFIPMRHIELFRDELHEQWVLP
jgi:hypothetical protein